jgi:hypothetical protein
MDCGVRDSRCDVRREWGRRGTLKKDLFVEVGAV